MQKKKRKDEDESPNSVDICTWMVKQIFFLIFRVESKKDNLDNDDNIFKLFTLI